LHAPDAALNPRDWVQPLRLNRRDDAALRKEEALAAGVELVEDPKWIPPVMEEQDKTKVAPGSVAKLDGMRKPFQKKTQRIFQTDESAASLQLSREERRPYLLEDSHEPATSKDRQRWIGRFEGGQTGSAITNTTSRYVLFLLTEDPSGGNGKMQVVSVDRSYKFTQKRLSKFKDVEQADQEERLFSSWLPKLTLRQFTRRVKSKYEDRWANRVKVEAGPSTSKVKTEPGAPRIKTEDLAVPKRFTAVHGENKRRKPKVAGDDQSDGEFDFDEEFQDDEEGAGGYMDDNALMDESEAKELAEKIKKDQKGGLVGDGADKDELFDASDSDEERRKLNKAGKEALKLLKKQGRNEYMDSDDELEVCCVLKAQMACSGSSRRKKSRRRNRPKQPSSPNPALERLDLPPSPLRAPTRRPQLASSPSARPLPPDPVPRRHQRCRARSARPRTWTASRTRGKSRARPRCLRSIPKRPSDC
jgi:transcription initiation factor TFIIF subunit alpha